MPILRVLFFKYSLINRIENNSNGVNLNNKGPSAHQETNFHQQKSSQHMQQNMNNCQPTQRKQLFNQATDCFRDREFQQNKTNSSLPAYNYSGVIQPQSNQYKGHNNSFQATKNVGNDYQRNSNSTSQPFISEKPLFSQKNNFPHINTNNRTNSMPQPISKPSGSSNPNSNSNSNLTESYKQLSNLLAGLKQSQEIAENTPNPMDLNGLSSMDLGLSGDNSNSNSSMANSLLGSLAVLKALSNPETFKNFNVSLNIQGQAMSISFTSQKSKASNADPDNTNLQNNQAEVKENSLPMEQERNGHPENQRLTIPENSNSIAGLEMLKPNYPSNGRLPDLIIPPPVPQKLSVPLSAVAVKGKEQALPQEREREIETDSKEKSKMLNANFMHLPFYIDIIPINSDNKEIEFNERHYKMIGQDRIMRTQEKNLRDKLGKFFGEQKEEQMNKEPVKMGTEEKIDPIDENCEEEEEDFNFDSRYFMYNPTKVCRRCKKPGHFEKWCPEEAKLRCGLCLNSHRIDECDQIVCFNCNQLGHRSRDCQFKGNMVCYRCGKRGHKNTNCGVIIDRDPKESNNEKIEIMNVIACFVCGEYGHINCKRPTVSRGDLVDTVYVGE